MKPLFQTSFLMLLALLASSLMLTGCGGGQTSADTSNVSIAVPKSSTIAASSKAASKAASSKATSSNPAGSVVSNANLTSHNPGEDCMTCHRVGGTAPARATFTVAGTVFNGNSGVAGVNVSLYLHNQNTLSASLTTDKTGNFYTTVTVVGVSTDGSLVTGVDAQVATRPMPGVVSNGSCNSCHSPAGGTGRIN